ncbi:bZIP Maf transcription factor [Phytophthora infestans]|uniref:BZIP Maf transcription factor n=1 Tax=Phytophthora infestans TaxID=4787 RepID=A0A833S2J2_PHYIN|nr:bZIP Maf transcription factor [Phytophthora infestans]
MSGQTEPCQSLMRKWALSSAMNSSVSFRKLTVIAHMSKASSGGLGFSIPLMAIHGGGESENRMLTPPPSSDLDSASPRTDASWPSDDELNEMVLQKTKKRSNSSAFSTEGMSAEAIKQHKAQRRREQVRAASRRCRDRQRKETEDLRTKVFQLEEFITHTRQAHEWEMRQQHERLQTLQHENELL